MNSGETAFAHEFDQALLPLHTHTNKDDSCQDMWLQTKCCKANTYADVNESFKQKRWWWCYIDLQQGLSIGVCHLSIAHTHTHENNSNRAKSDVHVLNLDHENCCPPHTFDFQDKFYTRPHTMQQRQKKNRTI